MICVTNGVALHLAFSEEMGSWVHARLHDGGGGWERTLWELSVSVVGSWVRGVVAGVLGRAVLNDFLKKLLVPYEKTPKLGSACLHEGMQPCHMVQVSKNQH